MALVEKSPDVNLSAPIDPAQIESLSELSDEAALQLVVQDLQRDEAWLEGKMWSLRWREADILYQPPLSVLCWEGTTVPRANVTRYTVATHLNSILPQLMSGLFYNDPPMLLRPREGTTEESVRGITALLSRQLDDIDFEPEVERGLFSQYLFGTGIWKRGWKTHPKKVKRYVRRSQPQTIDSSVPGAPPTLVHTAESDKFDVIETTVEVNQPTFEAKDIRFIFPDTSTRVGDIRCAGHVTEVTYKNFYQLMELKDETWEDTKGVTHKRYDLPSEDEIRSWFAPPVEPTPAPPAAEQANYAGPNVLQHAEPPNVNPSADPLSQPLEIAERWDCEKAITVVQRKRLIRKEAHGEGSHPYYSANMWDVPDSMWGMGLGRVIGQDQRVSQGMINALLDITSLVVNPTYLRNRGANVPSQQIRQRIGGEIAVDGDPRLAYAILPQPPFPAQVFAEIAQAEQRAEETSGANQQLTIGSLPAQGRSSLGRTATGAGGLMNANATRQEGPLGRFIRQVFRPFLYDLFEMDKEKLPLSDLRQVLRDELGPVYRLDEEDFLNSRIDFDVLAGAHMAAKRGMAQALPLFTQIFENPALMEQLAEIDQKYVDIGELLAMMLEASEWKNSRDIIKPMTPEMKQRMQQKANPAMQKAQVQSQLQAQGAQEKAALQDQKDTARLSSHLIEDSLDRATGEDLRQDFVRATQGESETGEPVGTFGE
jgi:hypothetical protein